MTAALDVLLAAALVAVAWRVLAGRRPRVSVVGFVVLGLLSAIAWARLDAPDIALAEAAIGAGITGALLLDAVGRLAPRGEPAPRRLRAAGAVAGAAAAALTALVALAVLDLPPDPGPLRDLAAAALPETGPTHPATAVLLDFRAWDTLLEVAVLLAAAAAVLALRGVARVEPAPAAPPDPVLAGLKRVVLPAALLVSVYLLWLGTHAPGGAFQAGAVVAAAAVLLRLAGRETLAGLGARALALLLAAGLAVFLAVGLGVSLRGRAFLDYPPEAAYALVVAVEAAIAASVAVTLAALFALAGPRSDA